jgi:endonuclease/exonuclease/phosphatase family metal-dependent hydrolase
MKIRKLYACLIAAALIGGGIWHASLHRSTGPAEGKEIQGTEYLVASSQANTYEKYSQLPVPIGVKKEQPSSCFRIGTFNTHGCKGLDGRLDVDRVAMCLKDLDFVGLNEVHGPSLCEKQDQAALLGQRLGMAWLFTPAIRQWYWMEAGNGLLTKMPVLAWRRIPLIRDADYSYRNAVQVNLQQENDSDGRVIHVLLTHVNRRHDSEREAQLKEVISMFMDMAEPAVLMGDLNSTAQDTQIRQLMSSVGVIDTVGQVLGAKYPERIDWIFVRGLRCLEAGIVENDASDHPLIWAELE